MSEDRCGAIMIIQREREAHQQVSLTREKCSFTDSYHTSVFKKLFMLRNRKLNLSGKYVPLEYLSKMQNNPNPVNGYHFSPLSLESTFISLLVNHFSFDRIQCRDRVSWETLPDSTNHFPSDSQYLEQNSTDGFIISYLHLTVYLLKLPTRHRVSYEQKCLCLYSPAPQPAHYANQLN